MTVIIAMTTPDTETLNEKTTHPSHDSIFSDETAASKPWPDVVNLGHAILRELQLSDTNNTLVRWMAHYIAEVMDRAERADESGTRESAQRECADLIIRLWDTRQRWPHNIAPLSKVVPLIEKALSEYKYSRQHPKDNHTDWIAALEHLNSLQSKEMMLCWQGIFLQLSPEEVAEEIKKAKAFGVALDPTEQKILELLEIAHDWIEKSHSEGLLTREQQDEFIKAELMAINKTRESIIDGTVSKNYPIRSFVDVVYKEYVDDDDDDDD